MRGTRPPSGWHAHASLGPRAEEEAALGGRSKGTRRVVRVVVYTTVGGRVFSSGSPAAGQSALLWHGDSRQCWSGSNPTSATKDANVASTSSLKRSETGTCADSWHLNLPLGSAMGLKERCAQWLLFLAAKTACSLRHDDLRASAARHVCGGVGCKSRGRERLNKASSARRGARVAVDVEVVSLG